MKVMPRAQAMLLQSLKNYPGKCSAEPYYLPRYVKAQNGCRRNREQIFKKGYAVAIDCAVHLTPAGELALLQYCLHHAITEAR